MDMYVPGLSSLWRPLLCYCQRLQMVRLPVKETNRFFIIGRIYEDELSSCNKVEKPMQLVVTISNKFSRHCIRQETTSTLRSAFNARKVSSSSLSHSGKWYTLIFSSSISSKIWETIHFKLVGLTAGFLWGHHLVLTTKPRFDVKKNITSPFA
jgi:hypothetical protein